MEAITTNLFDKHYIATECRRLVKEGFYTLDTETTGLGDNDKIVEVALTFSITDFSDKLFNKLVNPGMPIPPEATAVHGITDEDVRGALDWPKILCLFEDTQVDKLVIYNAEYDQRLMEQSGGNPFKSIKPFCAMRAFAMFNGELKDDGQYKFKKLSDAAAMTGFVMPEGMQAHRAHADCLMTQHLIHHMAAWHWQPTDAEVDKALEQVFDTMSAMTLAEMLWPGRYINVDLSVSRKYDGEVEQECRLSVYEREGEKTYKALASRWDLAIRTAWEQQQGRPAITY